MAIEIKCDRCDKVIIGTKKENWWSFTKPYNSYYASDIAKNTRWFLCESCFKKLKKWVNTKE